MVRTHMDLTLSGSFRPCWLRAYQIFEDVLPRNDAAKIMAAIPMRAVTPIYTSPPSLDWRNAKNPRPQTIGKA